MKNMQSNRVKKNKKKNKRRTIEERLWAAYESFPEWQKKYFTDIKASIAISKHAFEIGYDYNPFTGKKYTPKQMLFSQVERTITHSLEITKREIYRKFREEESSLYAKYNSYVYRNGFSSAKWFLDNASIKVQGSIVSITVPLPKGKRFSYNELVLEYDYSTSVEAFVTAYMR